jgi:hypothetical protein
MSPAFWLSYGLLWLLVVGGSLLTFALLREIGRLQLQNTQSIPRDGLAIGSDLPEIVVSWSGEQTALTSFLRHQLTLVICALPNCSFCTDASNVARRWIEANPTSAGAVVLLNDTEVGSYGSLEPDIPVALVNPRDVLEVLQVRVAPFVYLADEGGQIRAKGVLNTGADLAQLLRAADTGASIDQSGSAVLLADGQR